MRKNSLLFVALAAASLLTVNLLLFAQTPPGAGVLKPQFQQQPSTHVHEDGTVCDHEHAVAVEEEEAAPVSEATTNQSAPPTAKPTGTSSNVNTVRRLPINAPTVIDTIHGPGDVGQGFGAGESAALIGTTVQWPDNHALNNTSIEIGSNYSKNSVVGIYNNNGEAAGSLENVRLFSRGWGSGSYNETLHGRRFVPGFEPSSNPSPNYPYTAPNAGTYTYVFTQNEKDWQSGINNPDNIKNSSYVYHATAKLSPHSTNAQAIYGSELINSSDAGKDYYPDKSVWWSPSTTTGNRVNGNGGLLISTVYYDAAHDAVLDSMLPASYPRYHAPVGTDPKSA